MPKYRTEQSQVVFPDADFLWFYKDIYDHPQTIMMHTHNYTEVVLVSSGKGYHVINDHKMDVCEGDFFIIRKEPPHAFYPTTYSNDENLSVMNIFVSDTVLDILRNSKLMTDEIISMFEEKEGDFLYYKRLNIAESNIVKRTIEKMTEEVKLGIQMSREMNFTYFLQMFLRVARTEKFPAIKFSRIEDIIDYVNENYTKNISLDFASKLANLSKSHFARTFKEITGKSFNVYMQKKRIEKACELLLASEKSVQEIATEVGYSNYKFFYELFKRTTGFSPKEYSIKRRKVISPHKYE